jgi:hypothetical protein
MSTKISTVSRGLRRGTAGAATLLTVAGAGVVVALTAPAAVQAAPPARKPSCVADRPDKLSAALTARLCGGRVEVADQRSATTQIFANPDGSFTAQVYREPVRARVGGAWVPVDLTLHGNDDGSITPSAHPDGLRIAPSSGTGTRDLVSMKLGGQSLSLSWTGPLPTPVLNGSTATYRDVRPGVDLIVQVTRSGFEQFFQVKTRAGLAQLNNLPVDLHGDALTFEPDGGGLAVRNKAGKEVGRSPTPLMWDADTSATGEHLHEVTVPRPVTTRTAGRAPLLGTPDAGWLNAADRKFPITIDPTVTDSTLFDTYVKSNDTVDRSGATDLELGYGSGGVARAFVQWDASAFVGTQITSATVNFWNWYSASCTASQWEIWTTGPTPSGVLWGNQPAWSAKEATSTATHGYCRAVTTPGRRSTRRRSSSGPRTAG